MEELSNYLLFEGVSEEKVLILAEILGNYSKTARIWTKELEKIDLEVFNPDMIIELDDENIIIDFKPDVIDDEYSKKAYEYVNIANSIKENDKPVNFKAITTEGYSETVCYPLDEYEYFTYELKRLSPLDLIRCYLSNNESDEKSKVE